VRYKNTYTTESSLLQSVIEPLPFIEGESVALLTAAFKEGAFVSVGKKKVHFLFIQGAAT
jgi:hypothetical protein